MSQISGVVQEVIERNVAGGKKAYDIVVAGQKYGAGLFKPKVSEGQYVTFTAVANGSFKNVERGTLKVSEYKPTAEDKAAPKQTVTKAVNSFDARQDAISRQAASNTAIAWLNFLQAADALPLAASKKGGAKQAALDAIRIQYEKEFYEANTGNEWKDISPNKAETSTGSEEEDSGAEPADEPWE